MGKYSLAMFEGEERWSRNCGSGIGLSNYKNVFRDDILVGNWQEDLYGNRINPDTTHAEQEPAHYLSVTMNDFDRKQIDPDRARGGSNVESMPYELHFTKHEFDKRKAHEMLWLGEKANDVTMPAIAGARQDLLQAKRDQWHEEVTKDVHSSSVSTD